MCLTQARYGISWGGIGAAMACYDEALSYSKNRIMFDKPIGGFQLQQARLADMLTEITKAQLLCVQLGRMKDAGTMTPQQVSLAKRNNVDMACECAREARRLLGANGILAEYQSMRHMANLESRLHVRGNARRAHARAWPGRNRVERVFLMRRAALGLGPVFLTAGLIGCGEDPGCCDPLPLDAALAVEVAASGLSDPLVLTAPTGDGRQFVVEQPGRIRIIDGTLVAQPFLDITGIVQDGGERGLLGLAFHPSYGTTGHFFVYYTNNNGDTRVVRYTVSGDPNVGDASSASTILSVAQPYSNHNGGALAFGPDGYLYVALGDGGDGGDPDGNGQDSTTLLGSILRIDVDGASPYTIPSDNPFAGTRQRGPRFGPTVSGIRGGFLLTR